MPASARRACSRLGTIGQSSVGRGSSPVPASIWARAAPPTSPSSRHSATCSARSTQRHSMCWSEPTESALGRLIPELGEGAAGVDAGLTPTAQTRLFHSLVRLLERASSDRPLVLELEDIHWADPSTPRLPPHTSWRTPAAARLLIVATFRAEETSRDHPISSVLLDPRGPSQATKLDLKPFDPDELEAQLVAILGQPPAKRLLAAIQARSEGNALFTEELMASRDPSRRTPVLDRRGAAQTDIGPVAGSPARPSRRRRRWAIRPLRRSSVVDRPRHRPARRRTARGCRRRTSLSPSTQASDSASATRCCGRRSTGTPSRANAVDSTASVAVALEACADSRRASDSELVSQLAYHWFEAKDHERALRPRSSRATRRWVKPRTWRRSITTSGLLTYGTERRVPAPISRRPNASSARAGLRRCRATIGRRYVRAKGS